MKKLLVALTLIFGLFLTGCYQPPDCEVYSWGDVTFYDNGPSWVWDGVYIEVDWADGGYNSGVFYTSKSYYDKAAGRADVYMEWEDADSYYWNYGYINVVQCGQVNAYLAWSKKKSASIEFVIKESGSVLKSDITSMEEFRKTIK